MANTIKWNKKGWDKIAKREIFSLTPAQAALMTKEEIKAWIKKYLTDE